MTEAARWYNDFIWDRFAIGPENVQNKLRFRLRLLGFSRQDANRLARGK